MRSNNKSYFFPVNKFVYLLFCYVNVNIQMLIFKLNNFLPQWTWNENLMLFLNFHWLNQCWSAHNRQVKFLNQQCKTLVELLILSNLKKLNLSLFSKIKPFELNHIIFIFWSFSCILLRHVISVDQKNSKN